MFWSCVLVVSQPTNQSHYRASYWWRRLVPTRWMRRRSSGKHEDWYGSVNINSFSQLKLKNKMCQLSSPLLVKWFSFQPTSRTDRKEHPYPALVSYTNVSMLLTLCNHYLLITSTGLTGSFILFYLFASPLTANDTFDLLKLRLVIIYNTLLPQAQLNQEINKCQTGSEGFFMLKTRQTEDSVCKSLAWSGRNHSCTHSWLSGFSTDVHTFLESWTKLFTMNWSMNSSCKWVGLVCAKKKKQIVKVH